MSSTAPEPLRAIRVTPPPKPLPCTGCYAEAKAAVLAGKTPAEIPEPLPGVIMVNGMLMCDVRHVLNVGAPPPSLLIAPADAIPNGGLIS